MGKTDVRSGCQQQRQRRNPNADNTSVVSILLGGVQDFTQFTYNTRIHFQKIVANKICYKKSILNQKFLPPV
jgi:hypothetical protein